MTDDGASVAEHLESGQEQLKKIGRLKTLAEIKGTKPAARPTSEPEDIGPEFPYPVQYLWETFLQIGGGVAHDDWGAPVITWGEIRAWMELVDTTLEPWEVTTIINLATVAQSVLAKAYTDRMKVKKAGNG